MPRLTYLYDVVWDIFKIVFMFMYTVSVLCACLVTVILNVILVGNAGGLVSCYALIGVLVIFKWALLPKKVD